MKRIIVALLALVSSLLSSYAINPDLTTAMGAVATYTQYLEMALVTHDQSTIKAYAEALGHLVMTGNVPTSAEPKYQDTSLPKIEGKAYGLGKKKATEEQAARLYRALNALSYVNTLFPQLLKEIVTQGSTPHSKVAYRYYTESKGNPTLQQFTEATAKETPPAYASSPYVGIVLADPDKATA